MKLVPAGWIDGVMDSQDSQELWGFKSAVISGFPSVERKGRYQGFANDL